jgi:hypothetical protein
MRKLIAIASASVAAILVASPAAAVSPVTQATASAKIFKPLTISKVQDLDFGVIVLTGASFSNETVTVTLAGTVTCGTNPGVDLTCSGTPQAAKYHLVGTNNAKVTVSSPGFNLSGPTTLAFSPTVTSQTVDLGSAGSTTGVDVILGGSISVSSSTPDGLYSGLFAVTADYQ